MLYSSDFGEIYSPQANGGHTTLLEIKYSNLMQFGKYHSTALAKRYGDQLYNYVVKDVMRIKHWKQ